VIVECDIDIIDRVGVGYRQRLGGGSEAMRTQTYSPQVLDLELPESAPRIRITTGLGTATQKSWNLRRPVTLIGSRRPAHIVLHDRSISPAHCVIINTGTEVLLKDLYSRSGTSCNDSPTDLSVLSDGDVVTISGINIQVAIQGGENTSADSASGCEFADPTILDKPVNISLVNMDVQWQLREAAVLIGRHEAALIRFDHEDISRRHALIFRFKAGPAIFDMGGQGGLRINSRLCTLAPLRVGDRITIGPYRLQLDSVCERRDQTTSNENTISSPERWPALVSIPEAPPGSADVTFSGSGSGNHRSGNGRHDTPNPPSEPISDGIRKSWDQLDGLQEQIVSEATHLGQQETTLSAREAELDTMDAALRGQLHDINRLEEQLAERERKIESAISQQQREGVHLATRLAECEKREADLARRHDELTRREHVFAQRWSRLRDTMCPGCGKKIPREAGTLPT